jgi:hypothetical protein
VAHELYLDADSCDGRLIAALMRAGFDVALGTVEVDDGASDTAQLARAVVLRRPLITGNTEDFARIHNDLAFVGQEHFGIVTVRRSRPRSPEAIAAVITALLLPLPAEGLRNSLHRI